MPSTTPVIVRTKRSTDFGPRAHRRYWWHRFGGRSYAPPVYSDLSDEEWALLEDWFEDSQRVGAGGEMSIPMISVLQAFIMGSGIRSIVQLGHYKGYSTLMIGFMLRRMGIEKGLVSIDLDPKITDYARGWVERAGLEPYVTLLVNDSAAPAMPAAAEAVLGRAPRCVIIDSSHQYAHTLRELDLWWGALAPGGMVFLHDCSEFARQWDTTGEGGVRRAIQEWLARHPEASSMLLEGDPRADDSTAYADGCGLGILQKPLANPAGQAEKPA
ncbi:MAG: class I SAM-dependent methyltransferase [Phycisphaerales bacterium]|nr:class I SAM-dependent methyltransferase [Phycisphaerales bacterium]